jgi:hypothetical protein
MAKVLAIQNHVGLCWKCLQSLDQSQIHNIIIPEMGYGSSFDGEGTKLQLCDECYQESIKDNNELWSMEEIKDIGDDGIQYGEEYKYEKEMLEYIETLPLQGKQFVWNEFNHGFNADCKMEAQDWIDYELNLLPHDKCNEYGYYSPDEKQAYKERFPTCQFPVNRIYNEDSKGCWCPFGAYGEYGQTCRQTCTVCYQCPYYMERTTPIQDITDDEYEGYVVDVKYMIRHGKEII